MRTLAVFFTLLAAVPVVAQDTNPSTIVTTGEATVRKPPDVAFVTVAVETRARASREAQSANADLANAVLKRIADMGIPKDALRTSGLRIEQEYDFNNGRRTPRGWVARNAIEVRMDDVTKVGEVSDAAVQAGATSIDGVRFDLKDRGASEREALRMAVADARARAEAIAAGAGRSVGQIVKIEEGRVPGYEPRPMVAMDRMVVGGAQPTPVEPGFIDVRAHVVLTVAIR